MDIARPEFKRQKRRRQIIWGAIGLVCLSAVTVGVSRLKPAAPEVERSTVWPDTVKCGPMLRQVRGLGSLIPSQEFTRQIPAETEATVVRIRMLPGSHVKADTILLEMSNPQVEQAAVDARLQLKAAEAEYQSLRVKLQSDLMNQKAGAACWSTCAGNTSLGTGTHLGLILCAAAWQAMHSVVYGVGVYDAPTLLSVVLVLASVTLIAAPGPTLRIAPIDPAETLREE